MAAFPSPAQSSDRMAPIQKKWNPEMEKARQRERENGRDRKRKLSGLVAIIQMSLG